MEYCSVEVRRGHNQTLLPLPPSFLSSESRHCETGAFRVDGRALRNYRGHAGFSAGPAATCPCSRLSEEVIGTLKRWSQKANPGSPAKSRVVFTDTWRQQP